MIDALHFILGVQRIPRASFIRVDNRSLGDARTDERKRLPLGAEHGRKRAAIAFTDNHDSLALAVLIAGETAITAVFAMVGGLHIAAKIPAIDFRDDALASKLAAFHFLGHGLAKLMEQYERSLIGQAEVARNCQGALALHLVAEDRDGREIAAQRKLVERKECPACNREILAAGPATESEQATRAAALIGVQTAAMRANRRAICLRPAHLAKHRLGFRIRHAEDLSEAQCLGRAGKEKMLCHL